jgi:CheY-like chemotaxis protein
MAIPSEPVLVVDDHGNVREALKAVLEGEGYSVVTASHGAEALELLLAGIRPCLIIMDLMMPIMNGFEFREAQLRDPRFAPIPFVALSGEPNVAHYARRLRADGYFDKMMDPMGVLEVVHRVCARED